MSDFIEKLRAAVKRDPSLKVFTDYRVSTENKSLEEIKQKIKEQENNLISMKVITHGRPQSNQPELKGDGVIVVIRVEKLAKDHLKYLESKQS